MDSETIERAAQAMAENAGFVWQHCAQSQWRSDAEVGLKAAGIDRITAERDDYKDDSLRLHREKMDFFDRAINAEAERDRLKAKLKELGHDER